MSKVINFDLLTFIVEVWTFWYLIKVFFDILVFNKIVLRVLQIVGACAALLFSHNEHKTVIDNTFFLLSSSSYLIFSLFSFLTINTTITSG